MLIQLGNNVIPGSGLGIPLRSAGAPTGTTFVGIAAAGALCLDTTNKILYQNQGTQAAPVWVKVGAET